MFGPRKRQFFCCSNKKNWWQRGVGSFDDFFYFYFAVLCSVLRCLEDARLPLLILGVGPSVLVLDPWNLLFTHTHTSKQPSILVLTMGVPLVSFLAKTAPYHAVDASCLTPLAEHLTCCL